MHVAVLLLLLLQCVHIITSTVYTVTPDDHYYPNTTCHRFHNLQHYLLNVTKYFTSNTQLLFLPGLHHLHTDLIIQSVHNISLIGSIANGTTLDTVIQCNSSSACGMLISNIENIHIKNLVFKKFSITAIYQRRNIRASIEFFNCLNVYLQNVMIIGEPQVGIIATNVLKEFSLFSTTSKDIKICYTEDYMFSLPMQQSHTTLSIDHFILIPNYKFPNVDDYYSLDILSNDAWYWYLNHNPFDPFETFLHNSYLKFDFDKYRQTFVALTIDLLQSTYNVSIKLSNTTFHRLYDYGAISINTKNCNNNTINTISISWCNFTNNNSSQIISLIKIITNICSTNFTGEVSDNNNLVTFQNCTFNDNVYKDSMIKIGTSIETMPRLQIKVILQIIGCIFQLNAARIIQFSGDCLKSATLFIENTNFQRLFEIIHKGAGISLSNVKLIFQGPVIFSEISVGTSLLKTNSEITFYSYIEFSSIKATHIIHGLAY